MSLRAAHATNFYVDNAVPSSGNGTSWASAWKGFSRINWSVIRPGDTIYISGGPGVSASKTYYETLTIGASGSSAGPITIAKGTDPGHNGTVIIDGQNSRSYGVEINSRNYVIIRDLTIRNHAGAGISVKYTTAGVLVENNNIYSGDPGSGNARGIDARNNNGANPLIVRKNYFSTPSNTAAQTDGIWSSGNNGVVYENNRLVISNNNTTGHSDGIQSYMDYSITIRGNWIEQANTAQTNNHGMWLSNTQSGGVIKVYNNVVLTPNLTRDSAVTHWAEPSWSGTGTIRLWNNTIYGGRRSLNLDKTPNAEVRNNILWPAANGHAIYIVNGAIPSTNIDNNIIWAPNANIAYVSGRTVSWSGWKSLGYDSNGMNTDPQFVDSISKDYHLRPTAPAIDIARMLSEVITDYDGTPRPQGAAPDVGAFERTPN
ncbi:right-handed parallel beta-helix repeat-containing protein [Benzoatithermus flavus]|uniref:Right-handed parallel beta-helix repeat-containing protein n=1 Tax=Benzoatithermus flavus TaxID=3108223 RepID=A0ABU8XNY8_9PROT